MFCCSAAAFSRLRNNPCDVVVMSWFWHTTYNLLFLQKSLYFKVEMWILKRGCLPGRESLFKETTELHQGNLRFRCAPQTRDQYLGYLNLCCFDFLPDFTSQEGSKNTHYYGRYYGDLLQVSLVSSCTSFYSLFLKSFSRQLSNFIVM